MELINELCRMRLSSVDYNLDKTKLLGKGGFGHVFKVSDSLGSDAIKKVKIKYKSVNYLLANVIEAKALKSLQHPNVIPLIDYSL